MVTMQVPSINMLQRRLYPSQSWISGCYRETNFNEARTVNKGKFLYFLDLCGRKVNLLEQMAVVTSVCSDDFKTLR